MKPKDIQRFFSKIKQSGSCWQWIASKDRSGYGLFLYQKRKVSSHRFSYILFFHDIPIGLEIDHLCKNKSCVNPDHLEAVTHLVNVRRGHSGNDNHESRKTYCPQGHQYSKENTRTYKNGSRACKECVRNRNREYQRKLKRNKMKRMVK